jgi:hypothetical protein
MVTFAVMCKTPRHRLIVASPAFQAWWTEPTERLANVFSCQHLVFCQKFVAG